MLGKFSGYSYIIPGFPEAATADIFPEKGDSVFVEPDANIAAWLPKRFPATGACRFVSTKLSGYPDNEDLVAELGGEERVRQKYLLYPQQIRHLCELSITDQTIFLRDLKRANLVLTENPENGKIFAMAMTWDFATPKFFPTIYKKESVLRPWRAESILFLPALIT